MKKVCFVIDNLSGGGAEKQVIKLAQEFAKNGYEPHIITVNNIIDYDLGGLAVHSLADAEDPPATLLKRVLDSNILGNLATNAIKRLLSQWKLTYSLLCRMSITKLYNKMDELGPFAVVFSNLIFPNFLCIAGKMPNLYCCIHRDIEAEIKFPWSEIRSRRLKEWLLIKRIKHFYGGQHLIAVSDELKQTTLDFGIKPASIQSIYNIFDFNEIRELSKQSQPEEYIPEESIKDDYIIYMGRIGQEKNLKMLVNAYHQSSISQKLLILGTGPKEAEIKDLAARLNLQDKVILKGFVQNPYPYVKHAKALVLASDVEGLPSVLIEALILGTPVVSTSCPTGPKEILTGELAEFLSPPGDTRALADNIRKVIDSPPKIKDEHIAKFHKDANFRKYLALIGDASKQAL